MHTTRVQRSGCITNTPGHAPSDDTHHVKFLPEGGEPHASTKPAAQLLVSLVPDTVNKGHGGGDPQEDLFPQESLHNELIRTTLVLLLPSEDTLVVQFLHKAFSHRTCYSVN